jgi:hypothetical protein
MQEALNTFFQNRAARTVVLIVLILPISAYLGTIPVRSRFLHYTGIFAPGLVAAVGLGLWTWSWKWFGVALVVLVALTTLIQILIFLLR